MSLTPDMTRSSSSTDRRMVRGAALAGLRLGVGGGDAAAAASAPGSSAAISAWSLAGGKFLAGLDRGDHLADAVDDGEHRADQRMIGRAAPGAAIGERVLGGVAQRFEARKIEEAAIALHGVDEAENAVEPGAVVGAGFPGDDLAAQRFEHFAAFGHEIGNKVVHVRAQPRMLFGVLYAAKELRPR